MIRIVALAVALFLAVEGSLATFWPRWVKRKMADLKEMPDRTLGFTGFIFILGGGLLANLAEGALQIVGVAILIEGLLYGFLPMLMKRVMAYAVAAPEYIIKVWGETALGIGTAGLVLFY
jgi:uncharacterized protein YjeT (DUF2065 family)